MRTLPMRTPPRPGRPAAAPSATRAKPVPSTRPTPPRIDDASGAVREARLPAALGREAYALRADAPVRVARRAADPRPSTTDAAATHPRRTRGWARLLILLAVMVAVVAVAAVGVALLLG